MLPGMKEFHESLNLSKWKYLPININRLKRDVYGRPAINVNTVRRREMWSNSSSCVVMDIPAVNLRIESPLDLLPAIRG